MVSFGEAIEAMRKGHKVARTGWNGKRQWVWLVEEQRARDGTLLVASYFEIKTMQGHMQPGWLATQADMLANDWVIVEATI